jgi:hypothetical protein
MFLPVVGNLSFRPTRYAQGQKERIAEISSSIGECHRNDAVLISATRICNPSKILPQPHYHESILAEGICVLGKNKSARGNPRSSMNTFLVVALIQTEMGGNDGHLEKSASGRKRNCEKHLTRELTSKTP